MPTPNNNPHLPNSFANKDLDSKLTQIKNRIDDGLEVWESVCEVIGIHKRQFYRWREYVEEDLEAGFTEEDSELIRFMMEVSKYDLASKRVFTSTAKQMALDGDADMLKFILERRYGMKKSSKNEVEVTGDEKKPVSFTIVDMKPNENDE